MDTTDSTLRDEKQAAQELGVQRRTLQQWRFTGTGPRFVRLSPRCIRYDPVDLRTYLEERKHASTAEYE